MGYLHRHSCGSQAGSGEVGAVSCPADASDQESRGRLWPGPSPHRRSWWHSVHPAHPCRIGCYCPLSQKGEQGRGVSQRAHRSQMWTTGRFRAPFFILSPSSRAAVTDKSEPHRPGAQMTHKQFSLSGGWKPGVKVPTDSVFGRPHPCYVHMARRGHQSPLRALQPSWGPRLQTPSRWGSGRPRRERYRHSVHSSPSSSEAPLW